MVLVPAVVAEAAVPVISNQGFTDGKAIELLTALAGGAGARGGRGSLRADGDHGGGRLGSGRGCSRRNSRRGGRGGGGRCSGGSAGRSLTLEFELLAVVDLALRILDLKSIRILVKLGAERNGLLGAAGLLCWTLALVAYRKLGR